MSLWRSRLVRCLAPVVLSALAVLAKAASPPNSLASQAGEPLSTITVEAERGRTILERRVKTFVSGITTVPYQQSLAQWEKQIPICPQVAGLPLDDGEYLLSRLSQIARDAGAALAPESCTPNLHILVSSVPNELLAEWSKRNPWMFGRAGGIKIRKFLNATDPVRVWYNTNLFSGDGVPCKPDPEGIPVCERGAEIAQIGLAAVRDFSSVIIVVDARRTIGISMSQLAGYVAMIGLAEIRINPKLGDAPTILRLFTDSTNAAPLGMSLWDAAYLKALYQTQHQDRTQLLSLKTSMIKNVAP